MSRSRLSALLLGAALFAAPPLALGQDPLSSELEGEFSSLRIPPIHLSSRLPRLGEKGDPTEVWVAGYRRLGLLTQEAGRTTEKYSLATFGAGASVPFTVAKRRTLFQIQHLDSWLDARVAEGDVPSVFRTGELRVAHELSPRFALAASVRDREARMDYSGPLLGSGLSGIGVEPDLDLRLREQAIGLAGRVAFRGGQAHLGFGSASLKGSLDAVGSLDRLRLPLDMAGTDLTFAVDRELSDRRTVGLSLGVRSVHGEGSVRRGGPGTIGDGTSELRTFSATLSHTERLRNGGSLRVGIEHARSRFEAGGRVPDARQTGVDAPGGSSLRYFAQGATNRTEAAVRWEVPQRRGRVSLSYRHAIVDAEATVGYSVRLFLVGIENEATERLERTHAGIFDIGYERRFGEFDATFSLQQIVPYRFGSGGGGGGIGGGGGGSSSRTEGGWTLGLRVGRRF